VIIGAVVLHQFPSALQVLGVALVVTAGIGAARRGQRELYAESAGGAAAS
jgi:threonine/homoserine efflux transporter RhtA